MFAKVLIANRGEIARRILRTLRRMGVASVAVYSEADVHAPHVKEADQAVLLGPAPAAQSYLRVDRILAAAGQTGAQAIHPGYGFLSEHASFAATCEAAGVRFIGPRSAQIESFGKKHLAREIAAREGVALLPGTGLLATVDEALVAAKQLGYPVMLKSTAGGGGIGLRVCRDEAELRAAWDGVQRLGKSHFDGSGVFLERFVEDARHVEVQIFGDGRGHVLALGERDCSAQRRHQKVIEETPAPGLSPRTRTLLAEAAVRLCRGVAYESAGTVEFVVDARTQDFFFLEVNTRLQVEHGVTEAVTGLDLVEWMVRQAAGELVLPEVAPTPRGAAIEVRLYAEDPARNHQPSTGTLTEVVFPGYARVDGWIATGSEITPHYDPLLAKLIVHGETRALAVAALARALGDTRLGGLQTNLEYLRHVVATRAFADGGFTTDFLAGIDFSPHAAYVLSPGTQTTVQDFPGRLGLWAVGVPPSGPMDDLAFTWANRLLGNPADAAALEITVTGPTLRFARPATIALTGAAMNASIDGQPLPSWQAVHVPAGATLKLGALEGRGLRAYLAVRGGFDVPAYLSSRATFMLGRFGGHAGRALRAGDVLPLGDESRAAAPESAPLPLALRPVYPEIWDLGVLYGPHGAPDFFTDGDIDAFFAAIWQVHYNSDRTGVRLIGPKPTWARRDGGEAGLHPSNIHDNAYAVGTVDYTGDMPVILGPDGPSLGGFVCPATLVRAERWKMGQLKAGDRVRFVALSPDQAAAREATRTEELATLQPSSMRAEATPPPSPPAVTARARAGSPILAELPGRADGAGGTRVVYRRSGDDYLLVEYGPLTLDLALRFRVHALMEVVQGLRLDGVIDLTPGIRSLQIHYDPRRLSTARLLDRLRDLEADLPGIDEIEVPTRVVHLPLSWEDPATLLAIEKYSRSVRSDAPWCPSNIEFIRRINGLASTDDVRRIVFDARYLVLGLGDVYLGAPVATPVDPRHRLVTTKYNPARTWTPENAVGIGGAYLCIYGMEGPGGYQFVGRTLQMWNTYRQTEDFRDGHPYLLRFFDQIRFYPVAADELLRMREAFPHGGVKLEIEHEIFRHRDYTAFLTTHAAGIKAFKRTQQAAFEDERERWRAAGQDVVSPLVPDGDAGLPSLPTLPPGCSGVTSPVAGSVWKVVAEPGCPVDEGDAIVIVEAMKMEIPVPAPSSGVVREVLVSPGTAVLPGQTIAVVGPRG